MIVLLLLVLFNSSYALWFPIQGHGYLADHDKYFLPADYPAWVLQGGVTQHWKTDINSGNLGANLRLNNFRGWFNAKISQIANIGTDYEYDGGLMHTNRFCIFFLNFNVFNQNLKNTHFKPTFAISKNINHFFAINGAISPINTCTPWEISIQWTISEGTNMTVNFSHFSKKQWALGLAQTVRIAPRWHLRLGYWYPARTFSLASEFIFNFFALAGSFYHHPKLEPSMAYNFQL
ncbi:MAG: hypothetical protein GX801_00925 [Fibrobacter sp.]|nr:hypothetical protein [Fibrobacter sp.]